MTVPVAWVEGKVHTGVYGLYGEASLGGCTSLTVTLGTQTTTLRGKGYPAFALSAPLPADRTAIALQAQCPPGQLGSLRLYGLSIYRISPQAASPLEHWSAAALALILMLALFRGLKLGGPAKAGRQ